MKKIVAFWLMPLPLSLALLGAGFWFLTRGARPRLGRGLVISAILLLVVLSNRAVSVWLIRPLETTYPPVPELVADTAPPARLATCEAVVVLGGGHTDSEQLAATTQLSESARARLLEAFRLLRVMPAQVRLVVCGRGAPGRPTHATMLANAAISLGVAPERIVRLHAARDTVEEAAQIREVLGDAPFALVTSAWHMRRAAALMRGAGLRPVPCPADYLATPDARLRWADLLCDIESLGRSTRAIRERLGYVWARLRGQT